MNRNRLAAMRASYFTLADTIIIMTPLFLQPYIYYYVTNSIARYREGLSLLLLTEKEHNNSSEIICIKFSEVMAFKYFG